MKPIRFLPEPDVLNALLSAAGVEPRSEAPERKESQSAAIFGRGFSLQSREAALEEPSREEKQKNLSRKKTGEAAEALKPRGGKVNPAGVKATESGNPASPNSRPRLDDPSQKTQRQGRLVFRYDRTWPIEAKLEALLKFLLRNNQALGAFLADGNGLPLAQIHTPEHLAESTAPLGLALHQLKETAPSLRKGTVVYYLGDQQLLQLVWCETSIDWMVLGILAKKPMENRFIPFIRTVLKKIFD